MKRRSFIAGLLGLPAALLGWRKREWVPCVGCGKRRRRTHIDDDLERMGAAAWYCGECHAEAVFARRAELDAWNEKMAKARFTRIP